MSVFGNNYAKYYDLLYKDKDYVAESDYIAALIEKHHPKTILELGCGTGKHARILGEKGFEVFGVDLSEQMIAQAKKLGISCQVDDVRTFRAEKKFDAVISLFHIVSYQTTDEDVLNFFETVSAHLEKGGVIAFDIWFKPAVLAQLPEKRVKEFKNNEIKVKRFCSPNHLAEKSVVEVNYDIEITDKKSGNTEKISETHPMRYFSSEEITDFAKQKGIEIIHSEEWMTKNTPDENTWGVCFVGIKK